MYTSYQVPAFNNVFPTDIYSTDSQANNKNDYHSMNDQEELSVYSNNTLGLEIRYPIWMNKIEKPNGVELTFPDKNAGVIVAVSEVNNSPGENYVTSHLLYLNQSLDNLHVLNTSRTDLMGFPTAKIMFTYDNATQLYKGMQFWNIKENQARLFTYFAPSERVFDELLPTINRMLETLKVS
jgi:hypothetical protein